MIRSCESTLAVAMEGRPLAIASLREIE